MITGTVKLGFVLSMVIGLHATSCKGGQQHATNGRDSTILARSAAAFSMDNNHPLYQVSLNSTGEKRSGKKATLLFEGVSVPETPDGVFEVYLTNGPIDIAQLRPTHAGFVGLLDLYAMTAPDAKQQAVLEMRDHLDSFSEKGYALPATHLVILFRGNVSSSGQVSKKVGVLRVQGIRLVQVD